MDINLHEKVYGHTVKIKAVKKIAYGPQGQPYFACSWHECSCGEKSEPTAGYCWQ